MADFMMFLLLDEEERKRERKKRTSVRFLVDDLCEESFEPMFRFDEEDFDQLLHALQLPEDIVCENGIRATDTEALAILLTRLSYPTRYIDMVHETLGREPSQLSRICTKTMDILYNQWRHLLYDVNQQWIRPDAFAQAIMQKNAPLPMCWGFIDGTLRAICKPKDLQEEVYSGHKRHHGLKYQAVVTPDGMIANLFGPIPGNRHDSALLQQSGLIQQLEQCPRYNLPNGSNYYLYGDAAYPLHTHLMTPFRNVQNLPDQQEFNTRMSEVRQAVEWGFAKVARYFAFVDFKKNQKLFLQPVGKMYIIASLFANCHTCLRGNQTLSYFHINPPTLQQYLV